MIFNTSLNVQTVLYSLLECLLVTPVKNSPTNKTVLIFCFNLCFYYFFFIKLLHSFINDDMFLTLGSK